MAQASAIRTAVSLALLMAGFGLLVASYWLPWHHIGNPSAECAFSGCPFPIFASGNSAATLVLSVVRRHRIALVTAALALGFVLAAPLAEGYFVSGNACGPTSTSGPAYGWIVAAVGGALTFLGAIARWRWASATDTPPSAR